MKSRISFFNKTIFKKNLTRFAPAWGLYALCLCLGLILMLDSGVDWLPRDMIDCVQFMCIVTPCYALLVAQLLFGDLYNSRMCNALHALPLRREEWFFTNVVSGFVFHLIPTLIMSVLATVFILLGGYYRGWPSGPMWLLGVNLQYLCFFGIAVLSVFCVGSRFAMAVVYGILNFGSIIVGWIVHTLYTPMFYGIQTNMEPFLWFCPVGQMMEEPFLSTDQHPNRYYYVYEMESNFWYYFLCAAVGIVLLVLALQLYRRRKLECAGDFMAVKHMEPVFQVVFTLVVGAVFQFVFDELFGMEALVFLFIGLAVGFFTGRMLLLRNVRVFQMKGWLGCGAVMVGFSLTLLIAALDPFGIETWVPDVQEVESVTICDGHYHYSESKLTMNEDTDIETILSLHREALEDRLGENGFVEMAAPMATTMPITVEETVEVKEEQEINTALDITLTYRLKSGRTVTRYYTYWSLSESGKILNSYFSSAACVFGMDTELDGLLLMHNTLIMNPFEGDEIAFSDREEVRGLLEALMADCEAGTMTQDWQYHPWEETICWLNFTSGLELRVFSDCENTIAWLVEHGMDLEKIQEAQKQY